MLMTSVKVVRLAPAIAPTFQPEKRLVGTGSLQVSAPSPLADSFNPGLGSDSVFGTGDLVLAVCALNVDSSCPATASFEARRLYVDWRPVTLITRGFDARLIVHPYLELFRSPWTRSFAALLNVQNSSPSLGLRGLVVGTARSLAVRGWGQNGQHRGFGKVACNCIAWWSDGAS